MSDLFDEACALDPVLEENWKTVARWSEESRYEFKNETNARAIIVAINKRNDIDATYYRIQ